MLRNEFEMKDLGEAKRIIGIEIERNKDATKIHQQPFILAMLKKFNMEDCRRANTPLPKSAYSSNYEQENAKPFSDVNLYQQAIGSLNWIATCTRPDITFSVNMLAAKMIQPTEEDWKNCQQVFRYLKATQNLAITYSAKADPKINGYADANYAESSDRKSIGGYIFIKNGGAISWKSKKQSVIAQSSMESEYYAAGEATKEALHLRNLETELLRPPAEPTMIYEDNQAAIKVIKEAIFSDRVKHFSVRSRAVEDYYKKKIVDFSYIESTNQAADAMTKSLGSNQLPKLAKLMGLNPVRTPICAIGEC